MILFNAFNFLWQPEFHSKYCVYVSLFSLGFQKFLYFIILFKEVVLTLLTLFNTDFYFISIIIIYFPLLSLHFFF